MVTVAVYYPLRALSLSNAALDKSEGIEHDLKEIVRESRLNQHGDRGLPEEDALWVRTLCGKLIDVAPETHQRNRRRCKHCASVSKTTPIAAVRVLPPDPHGVPPIKNEFARWDFARWNDWYWEHHLPSQVTLLSGDGAPRSRARTSQPTPRT